MNLMPLAQRLENAGLGVLAETIFINQIPAECPEGILLRNKLQGTKIDPELPGYYKTPFQLIVRATNYPDGDQLINDAFSVLTINEAQVDSIYVRRCRPLTLPVTFPISKGNLIELAADFEIVFLA